MGGEYVMRLAAEMPIPQRSIDSNTRRFSCLAGEQSPIRRLIITCSGGAFRDLKREELACVTAEQALRHPQWEMGAKITIDSTLVNKGFEVIEAHWLVPARRPKISVVLHPQSSIRWSNSRTARSGPARNARHAHADQPCADVPPPGEPPRRAVRLPEPSAADLAEVDRAKYPALEIAYDCLRRGTAACTMNGANEVAVAAFLGGRCAWLLSCVPSNTRSDAHRSLQPHPGGLCGGGRRSSAGWLRNFSL